MDKIVDGTPIAAAYEQLSGDKFDDLPRRLAGTICRYEIGMSGVACGFGG